MRLGDSRTLSLVKRGASPAQSRASGRALQVVSSAPLKFVLSGFTSRETRDINAFIASAYGRMVALYGQPAKSQRGRTVRIIKSSDPNVNGGLYDARPQLGDGTANPNFNTIEYYLFDESVYTGSNSPDNPFDDDNGVCNSTCHTNAARAAVEYNNYSLLRQMLLAFRGSELTAFDAWDGGQADAAALILLSQTQGRNFDPGLYGAYVLPDYDFFNRPDLGGKYFYTALENAGAAGVKQPKDSSYDFAIIRFSMAQAAWLKVWMEKPAFFALFNARYYERNTAVVGQNAQALAAIAGSVVPMVEGLSWNDWLRRQYVLDTSVRTGEHLYAFVKSFSSYEPSNLPAAFQTQVYHYRTYDKGDEQPVGGVGTLQAFDESGRDITSLSPQLRSDNRLVFDASGRATANTSTGDVSFDSTGKPDQARITLRFRAGAANNSAFYAHNVVGNTARLNGFYGVVNGSNSGRFTLQSNGLSTSGLVQRGSWLSASTYPTGPSVKTTFTLLDGSARTVFRRNTAWSFYQPLSQAQGVGFVFEAPPSDSAITASWTIRNANKWRLISLPETPFQTDDARALGISAASLSLARYASGLRPRTDLTRGFPFGITRARHTFYPANREPLGPGRAYWLKLDRDKSVVIPGAEPERAFAFDVPLLAGWNAIGVPFNLPFTLGSVRVRVGEETLSWDDALARGWVSAGVWKWKPEGGYARADLPGGVLAPLEGYFVWSSQAGAALVFDSSSRSAGLSAPLEGAGAWQVGLSVASGAGTSAAREDGFRFGSTTFSALKPARRAAARPPWGERSIALAFTSSGSAVLDASQAGNESGWAELFAPPLAASGARWSFVVDGAASGERAVLSWGDLSAVPAGFKLFLVDESSGTRLEMAQSAAHAYAWIASGPRRFRIEAVRGNSAPSS